jgi:hypothetical protein
MTPTDVLDLSFKITRTIGPFFGILLFLIILMFCFFFSFWKKNFENLADEITAKTLKSFDTRLSLSISDIEIRKELLLFTGKKSIETQLMLYEEIWDVYFKYREIWSYLSEKNEVKLNDIYNLIYKYRNNIYKNALFLSTEFYSYLSEASSKMLTGTYKIIRKCKNQEINDLEIAEDDILIIDNLDKARDFLNKTIHSHQNIIQYDLNEKEKDILRRDREDLFTKNE